MTPKANGSDKASRDRVHEGRDLAQRASSDSASSEAAAPFATPRRARTGLVVVRAESRIGNTDYATC
jgi:hypothetical protein